MAFLTNEDSIRSIYVICLIASAVAAVAFFVVKKIFANRSKGAESDYLAEVSLKDLVRVTGVEIKKPIEAKTFTVEGLFGFLIVFALSGLVLLHDELPLKAVMILSALFGFAGEVGTSLMAYAMKIKKGNNVVFAPQTVGQSAVVVADIPASKKGQGKIRCIYNNSIVDIKALSVDEVSLTKGTEVEILYAYSDTSVVVGLQKK